MTKKAGRTNRACILLWRSRVHCPNCSNFSCIHDPARRCVQLPSSHGVRVWFLYSYMQLRQAHLVASSYAGFLRVWQPTKQISYIAKAAEDPPPEPYERYNVDRRPRFFNRLRLLKPGRLSQSSAKSPLFQELFPDEAVEKASQRAQRDDIDQTLRPLSLRTDEGLPKDRDKPTFDEVPYVKEATKIAFSDAYKHRKTAVLVLQCASKSLIESDFRSIAPRGMHIRDWTGPGDIRTGRP